ncbi:MAG: hypothetical protein ABL901_00725 [Hyphomicrobiaceae bacterium]
MNDTLHRSAKPDNPAPTFNVSDTAIELAFHRAYRAIQDRLNATAYGSGAYTAACRADNCLYSAMMTFENLPRGARPPKGYIGPAHTPDGDRPADAVTALIDTLLDLARRHEAKRRKKSAVQVRAVLVYLREARDHLAAT